MFGEVKTTIQQYQELLNSLLSSDPLAFKSGNFRSRLPEQGGVYRIFEESGSVQNTVYIGQSNNLRNRIYRSHLMGNRQVSTLKNKLIKSGEYLDESAVKNYLREQCLIQFIIIENELDRNSFEHFSIAMFRPKFND